MDADELYKRYTKALQGVAAPALYLDLEAFEKNIQWALANAGNKKLRIATKSIRSVPLIRRILDTDPTVFSGLMSFTLEEALWLRSKGFEDVLVGYPTTDSRAIAELAKDPAGITLMVDLPEHLEMLARHHRNGSAAAGPFRVCLDLDLSLDLPFFRFGVFRSSIRSEADLQLMLASIERYPQVRLVGAMAYEAQIAGLMDKDSPLMRTLKSVSIGRLTSHRARMVELIRKAGHELEFVKRGGTGSMDSTSQDDSVTEMAVGSGFFAPVLFDHYQSLSLAPAAGFTLPIVRKPSEGVVTCLGGGYIASGESALIKTPSPFLPPGLELRRLEGAGEVQTPMYYSGSVPLNVGDVVFMRHAKAGEVCERFDTVHLIRGSSCTGTVSTYRGEGKCFL